MTFAAVTKILKVCIAAVILNHSSKREKRKLIYFSERKNNQRLKAVHPLQGRSATEEYERSNIPEQVAASCKCFGGLL